MQDGLGRTNCLGGCKLAGGRRPANCIAAPVLCISLRHELHCIDRELNVLHSAATVAAAGEHARLDSTAASLRQHLLSSLPTTSAQPTHHFRAIGHALGCAPLVHKAVGDHLAGGHLILADFGGHKGGGHQVGAHRKVEALAARPHGRGRVAICGRARVQWGSESGIWAG